MLDLDSCDITVLWVPDAQLELAILRLSSGHDPLFVRGFVFLPVSMHVPRVTLTVRSKANLFPITNEACFAVVPVVTRTIETETTGD